ncbi:MAG: TlpA family protein disulfide reductase [Luminiphilus sp.]|nr:TlpA family protein disulfide reductase [Luminiphilus sp.]MBL6821359.1 TlpA family protein disulfide reductase [Luminiphilus sp.]
MMRRGFAFLWAVAGLVVASAALASDKHDPAKLVPMDREALRRELSISQGSVVLVNLWATWCTPCLREIPDLLALESELPTNDFRLLAISMDDAYSAGWVTEFKAKHFPSLVSFINAELDMDTLVSVIDPVWNETLPTSYIFNREGEVVKKVQGKKPIEFFREQLAEAGL